MSFFPGAHPSSEGKRKRNRSNVEAMTAKHLQQQQHQNDNDEDSGNGGGGSIERDVADATGSAAAAAVGGGGGGGGEQANGKKGKDLRCENINKPFSFDGRRCLSPPYCDTPREREAKFPVLSQNKIVL